MYLASFTWPTTTIILSVITGLRIGALADPSPPSTHPTLLCEGPTTISGMLLAQGCSGSLFIFNIHNSTLMLRVLWNVSLPTPGGGGEGGTLSASGITTSRLPAKAPYITLFLPPLSNSSSSRTTWSLTSGRYLFASSPMGTLFSVDLSLVSPMAAARAAVTTPLLWDRQLPAPTTMTLQVAGRVYCFTQQGGGGNDTQQAPPPSFGLLAFDAGTGASLPGFSGSQLAGMLAASQAFASSPEMAGIPLLPYSGSVTSLLPLWATGPAVADGPPVWAADSGDGSGCSSTGTSVLGPAAVVMAASASGSGNGVTARLAALIIADPFWTMYLLNPGACD